MPILTQNIKILKSAVMADTTDGGGPMTGVAIVDGASNNLFPDTSAMDRAFGRVNLRKVFGVAHTTDRDTLMGAHAIITDAPDDPLVHCSLMKTTNWGDTRTTARESIERYLVKGPKAATRIYDTHYSGSLQLRLITFVDAAFPAGGEAVVLRNPNGVEQYVRILTVSVVAQKIAVIESGNVILVDAKVATCELGQAINIDVLGPPAVRAFNTSGVGSESTYAMLYTTSLAAGARFYGIKPLGVAGAPGALSVTTAGGVYNNLVPAATVETPIIDQYPLDTHPVIVASGYASLSLGTYVTTLTANSVLYAPGAIAPGSLSITGPFGTITDSNGLLMNGLTEIGTVDYRSGVITMSSTAPNYGSNSTAISYTPGAAVNSPGYSSGYEVTLANQGLSYVNAFTPVPAPGSFSLSYMAQGRWYELTSDMVGKVSGADSAYGIGTLNHSTGSMAVTLGAIPDIGSYMVASWGNNVAYSATPIGDLPTKLTAQVATALTASTVSGATITWSRGGTTYTATTSAGGVISGDATGQWKGNSAFSFTPNVFPSGALTVAFSPTTVGSTLSGYTLTSGTTFTLTGMTTSLQPGSVVGNVKYSYTTAGPFGGVGSAHDRNFQFYDRGGVLYTKSPYVNAGAETSMGTVNYATGSITFTPTLSITTTNKSWQPTVPGGSWSSSGYALTDVPSTQTFSFNSIVSSNYNDLGVVESATTTTVTPSSWGMHIDTQGATTVVGAVLFTLGSEFYSSMDGELRKGWSAVTGAATLTAIGSVGADGTLTVTTAGLPTTGTNSITWHNFAQDKSTPIIDGGIFRTASAPLKAGVFQIGAGALTGGVTEGGDLNDDFTGTMDFSRGICQWATSVGIYPATLSYNAVFLQYLPLDASLLGIETARLPLDGKVPIYRSGDLVVVHNTLAYTVVNPLVKDTGYDLGRVRLASVRVKDVLGVVVPDTLYTIDLNTGIFTVPTASDITAYTQPLTVEHRIEDMLLCSQVDISGQLKFTRSLTHTFPHTTSFVSSALPFGDLFARCYSLFEQATWTSVWQDTIIGSPIIAQYNDAQYPVVVTNQGAIKERWLILFTGTTTFRVIGESVGEIGTGNITTGSGTNALGVVESGGTHLAFNNPATNTAYFVLSSLGWGSGWSTGNCLRFNTDACGTPFWVVRTILQGPATEESDQFTLAFRGDVDRP